MKSTASEIFTACAERMDCSEMYEAIVAKRYITDVVVFSNKEHVLFCCCVYKHSGEFDELCDLATKNATRGEIVTQEVFFELKDALDWIKGQEVRIIEITHGGLSAEHLTV